MKYDIVICGVGGQGILALSAFLALCAQEAGFQVKQSEIHGMSQRGGAVVAHFRLADTKIYSPLIPAHSAEMLISMDPLEIYRYMSYASTNTKFIVSAEPVLNIPNYPPLETVLGPLQKHGAIIIEKATNIMLAGAAAEFLPIKAEVFEQGLAKFFARKGQKVLQKNQQDFARGRKER